MKSPQIKGNELLSSVCDLEQAADGSVLRKLPHLHTDRCLGTFPDKCTWGLTSLRADSTPWPPPFPYPHRASPAPMSPLGRLMVDDSNGCPPSPSVPSTPRPLLHAATPRSGLQSWPQWSHFVNAVLGLSSERQAARGTKMSEWNDCQKHKRDVICRLSVSINVWLTVVSLCCAKTHKHKAIIDKQDEILNDLATGCSKIWWWKGSY